jgi:hypothetical protein
MKPINRKQFKQIIDSANDKVVRNEIINDYISRATPRLNHRLLSATHRQEILTIISKFVTRNKMSTNCLYKIYLLADFPIEVVNQYEMRGSQCFRKSNFRSKPKAPVKQARASRRPSIYGWHGEVVPRSFLDKLSTPIRNQYDYDRMREKELGMSKEEYYSRQGWDIFNKRK